MDNAAIIEKINGFLVEEFDIEASLITPEANLREVLQLDSLDYIDLAVVIEGNFGFKLKLEDFATLITFKDFYDYVIFRLSQEAIT